VEEAGVRCPRCGDGSCAGPHATRYRKRVRDLSTGEVFTDLPILRVRFCEGKTASLMPADLWRGRTTVTTVVEAVIRVVGKGTCAALEWTGIASRDGHEVSERTLRRWRDEVVRGRLVGSALAVLGPQVGFFWSGSGDEAGQLKLLLGLLSLPVLLAFRAEAGHSVLDRPARPAPRSRSATRPIAGRLAPAPPHDPPSSIRARGLWSPQNRRGPPRRSPKGGSRS